MEKTIYIADDDSSIRKLTGDVLGRFFPEYEREFFEDGVSLLRRLEETDKPSLIITDNEMPGVTGSEIIEGYARKIPFILIYGGDEKIGKKAVADGACGYFLKPYNIKELGALAGKILNSK
ncbi:MAG: response regulator [Nanoarchaeota archaeon]|nr:response regulator [Nanoarchaeota archaeon]